MPTQQDYEKTEINSPYDVALALFSPKWLKKNILGVGGVIDYETTRIKTKNVSLEAIAYICISLIIDIFWKGYVLLEIMVFCIYADGATHWRRENSAGK